jgi:SUMO ligase MMS21 Smc5/6 complex component
MGRECTVRHEICSDIRGRIIRERANNAAPINEVDMYKLEVDAKRHTWTDANATRGDRHMKEIDKFIAKLSGSDDDDIVVAAAAAVRNKRCPITGGEIEKPLCNKKCSHVYSTAGIVGMLCQSNGSPQLSTLAQIPDHFSAKCPVAGCQHTVSKEFLERDYAMEMSQRQARKAAANRESYDDNDDDADVDDGAIDMDDN